MNVSVATASAGVEGGQMTKKSILIVTKDIEAGEEIYKEDPVVAALDPDLESTGSYCSHCLRMIDSAMSLRFTDDPLLTAYCSKACQTKARSESHNLLFGLDPPLPDNHADTPKSEDVTGSRKKAQEKLVASLSSGEVFPLLVARFISRQVTAETAKLGINSTGVTTIAAAAGAGTTNEEYSLYDHIERLRFLDLPTHHEEAALLSEVLSTAMPGLEQFVTDERYTILKGKMAYNALGVCYGGGRDDKPAPKVRPENVEQTRTPHGSHHQYGCGLYQVSSYLSHSCIPSARPSFPEGTSTLHLIANRALMKGDELTMAYVDVAQRSHESLQESRMRRRKELARGWRFACTCQRCIEEGASDGIPTKDTTTDESKVEDVVSRYEGNKSVAPEEEP